MRNNELPDLLNPRPLLYGIMTPDGEVWLDIYCVDPDREALERGRLAALNRDIPDESGRYQTVALYTADQVAAIMVGHGLSSTFDDMDRRNHGTFKALTDINGAAT